MRVSELAMLYDMQHIASVNASSVEGAAFAAGGGDLNAEATLGRVKARMAVDRVFE